MEKTQINLMVRSDQKKEWEDYVEDNRDFTSLSDLIRKSVHREMASAPQQTPQSIDVDLSEVLNSIDGLHSKVDSVTDRLETLEAITESPGDEITDLASQIYELLPVTSDPAQLGRPRPDQVDEITQDHIKQTGRFDMISAYFTERQNITQYDIRKACERLLSDMSRVDRTVGRDDTQVYYIRDSDSSGSDEMDPSDYDIHQNIELSGDQSTSDVDAASSWEEYQAQQSEQDNQEGRD